MNAGFAYNMMNGVDMPIAIPIERWDVENVKASAEATQGNSLRHAAFVGNPALFDSVAFRMAYGEAVGLDPQSRLLLESVHDAMQVNLQSRRDFGKCLLGRFYFQAGKKLSQVPSRALGSTG